MSLLTSCFFWDLCLVFFGLLAGIYAFFRHRFNHWRDRNIPYIKPSFPLGNFQGLNSKFSLGQIAADLCKKNKDKKVIGVYMLCNPVILVNDLELIKAILVKDFSSFHDRGFNINTEVDPLSGHLFLLNGKEWRNLRTKLTPTFTSGKMKMMFPTIVDVGMKLQNKFSETVNDAETEIKDLLARFTTDVIATCAFGLESNCLENPNSDFRRIGLELVQPTFVRKILTVLFFTFPNLSHYIKVRFLPKHISDFFVNIVRSGMEHRERNNVKRNDFLQLLLQLKTLGYVADVDSPKKQSASDVDHSKPFTIEEASAQAFLFYFAGFETSSSTMLFALYELAMNPDLQQRLHDEIMDYLDKNGGKITYDEIHQMDYLDRVISETLRKYPIAQTLLRSCTADYKIPGTDWLIEKNTQVWLPVYAYHFDETVYPDPDKFDPDRFLPEEKEKRNHYSYLPFGEGPRNCIGNRFGLMQTKVGLAMLLSKFKFDVSGKTMIPMRFDPTNDLLTPDGPIYMKVSSW